MDRTTISQHFEDRFLLSPPIIVRAPGRVNLIGEHTDYNDGYVMPMAIDRASWIALRPTGDGTVRLFSSTHAEEAAFDLEDVQHGEPAWSEYPRGVAWALHEAGYSLRGFEGVTGCDVPMGAGLSSSASFELATARAFAEVSGFEWDAAEMARIGQRAENEWVGVSCGIMDQMISASGREGHALLIDCRSLESTPVPLPTGTAAVVLDTATRRGLVDSAYNERRAQCEAAASAFGVKALRDLTHTMFQHAETLLDPVTLRRARHVVSENQRALYAAEAMKVSDADRLGVLMNQSHASLRDDFEVSSPELDLMSELARKEHGCYGARMTGAGFGGCAVALVATTEVDHFTQHVATAYADATGKTPAVYVCKASKGAGRA